MRGSDGAHAGAPAAQPKSTASCELRPKGLAGSGRGGVRGESLAGGLRLVSGGRRVGGAHESLESGGSGAHDVDTEGGHLGV